MEARGPLFLTAALGIPLLAALLMAAVGLKPVILLPVSFLLLVLIARLLVRYRLESLSWYILAAGLPLSFEMAVTPDTRLFFPSEPLLVLVFLTEMFSLVKGQGPYIGKLTTASREVWLMALGLILATAAHGFPAISVKYSLVFLSYLLVFYVLLSKKNGTFIERLLAAYSLALAGVALWGLYTWQGYGFNPVTVKGVFRPFFKDHTILGASASLLAVYWTGRLLTEKKGLIAFAALIALALTYWSGSRAAWWGTLLGLLFLFLPRFRFNLRTFTAGLALLAALIYWQWPLVREELESNRKESRNRYSDNVDKALSVGNLSTDESNLERLNRWWAALQMGYERPLTGFGPGQYQFVYHPYQNPEFKNRLTVSDPWHIPENSGGTAHSEWLLAFSEQGLAGPLAWLILWLFWTWKAFGSGWKITPNAALWPAYCALLTYALHSHFNNFLTSGSFAFLFWGTGALLKSQSDEPVLSRS